jgi:two-component system nitrogen regulation response regulator GlnG
MTAPINESDATPMEKHGGGNLTVEGAIELLLSKALADSSIQLLPWLEREFTLYAMKSTKGNQVKSAKMLGVTRATLRKRIERFNITRELTIQ